MYERIEDVLRKMGWEEVAFEGELRDAIAVSGLEMTRTRPDQELVMDIVTVLKLSSQTLRSSSSEISRLRPRVRL
jgi:hypothetical protein